MEFSMDIKWQKSLESAKLVVSYKSYTKKFRDCDQCQTRPDTSFEFQDSRAFISI